MKKMLMGAAALAALTSCAPAAYEIVRLRRDDPRIDDPALPPVPPPDAGTPPPEPTPIDSTADAPDGFPPSGGGDPLEPGEPQQQVEQSEPPWGDDEEGQQQQQQGGKCDQISVCNRRELPKCAPALEGLYAFVAAGGYKLVCQGGVWREALR